MRSQHFGSTREVINNDVYLSSYVYELEATCTRRERTYLGIGIKHTPSIRTSPISKQEHDCLCNDILWKTEEDARSL
jgi:hypothetical protein